LILALIFNYYNFIKRIIIVSYFKKGLFSIHTILYNTFLIGDIENKYFLLSHTVTIIQSLLHRKIVIENQLFLHKFYTIKYGFEY